MNNIRIIGSDEFHKNCETKIVVDTDENITLVEHNDPTSHNNGNLTVHLYNLHKVENPISLNLIVKRAEESIWMSLQATIDMMKDFENELKSFQVRNLLRPEGIYSLLYGLTDEIEYQYTALFTKEVKLETYRLGKFQFDGRCDIVLHWFNTKFQSHVDRARKEFDVTKGSKTIFVCANNRIYGNLQIK